MLSIIRATALETACDALALLITLAALALSTFAGALHYHQFGEPSRMAREAGLSAIMVAGVMLCVFSCVRTIRREIESQTVQMALSHSISRGAFLCAKILGVLVVYAMFFVTVLCNSIAAVRGSVLGAEAAQGGIARVWGPSLAIGVATLVLPLVVAAALSRFFRVRFVRSAMLLMLALSVAGVFYRPDFSLITAEIGIALALVPLAVFFTALAGALAARFASNAATTLAFLAVALALPMFGSHYLADAVRHGASAPWGYIALSYVAIAPLVAAALIAGVHLFNNEEL